jgi:hypothetical protein
LYVSLFLAFPKLLVKDWAVINVCLFKKKNNYFKFM